MISRIVIVAGLIAVVQGTFLRCRPNEVISFWRPRCSDKCSEMERPCFPRTIIGIHCVCRSEHKRDGSGNCVPKQNCCTRPNEVYSENGETDRNCDDVLNSRTIFRPIKPAKCICVDGTVRDGNQNCVSESQCYPTCDGENEVYKKNGTEENCNLNGNNPGESSMGSGCYCKDGFFRNEKDQTCVLKSDCQCPGDNEWYIARGGCEKDCMGNSCSYCGTPRCYCDEGYKRQINKDGTYSTCVKPEDCNCDP